MTLRSGSPSFTYYEGSDGLSDFPPIRIHESTPDPPLNRESSPCSPAVRRSKRLASSSRPRRSQLSKKGLGERNIVNMVQVTVEPAKVMF